MTPVPDSSVLWELSIDELSEHFLSRVPGAREAIEERGMAFLFEDEPVEIEGVGSCRGLWLGTGSSDSFVREIFYAVDEQGRIHEFDVPNNSWTLVAP